MSMGNGVKGVVCWSARVSGLKMSGLALQELLISRLGWSKGRPVG